MLILLKTPLELLNYIAEKMTEKHPEAIILDITAPDYFQKAAALLPFMDEKTVVVVLNGAGRGFEYSDGRNVWEDKGVRFYNYLIDHPAHYTEYLSPALANENFLVADRKHKQFINQYFPAAKNVYFLPLGTPELSGETPFAERDIPLLYIGSCQADEREMMEIPYFADRGFEYYRFAMERMERDFMLDMAEVACLYLREKNITLTKEEEVDFILLSHLGFQTFMRRRQKLAIMRALARSGIPLTIYGYGWEEVAEEFPTQIKWQGWVSPADSNVLAGSAKIALNVMPYFKDGSHDRIYIAMQGGALCFTDRSLYLEEKFTHGKDIVFFEHHRLEELCDNVKYYLNHPREAQQIIDNACQRVQGSKWSDRLETILRHDFESPSIV